MLKKDQKSYSAILWLVQLVLGISLVFANDSISLEFGEIDSENQIVPILYNSTSDITGFQFFIIGMDVTNIFGGTAEEYNFYLHQGSTCWRENECKDVVTGFSNSDSPIPPGEGILFYLNYAEVGDDIFDNNIQISYQTCLDINEGFIVGPQDNLFDVDLGECMNSPVDCNGDYFGSTNYDPCGICGGVGYIDDCGVCDAYENNDCYTYNMELSQGANLISFHALPEDASISSIFASLGNNANYIIGEGAGAYYMSETWYGSLQTITADEGYWLVVENAAVLSIVGAAPTSINENNLIYDLHSGNNLISYPFSISQSIDDAIDNLYLSSLFAMAGSAEATQYSNGNWYGSLENLNPSSGYWLVALGDIQFQYNQPNYDESPSSDPDDRSETPDLFTYTQSPYQAFYWVASAYIDGEPMVEGEDWVGAFYGDECIGSREWSGVSTYGIPTDVPVMGYDDEIPGLQDYIVVGEYPRFVVYDASEDIYYDANAYDNHIFEGALLAMYSVNEIKVERDCLGILGGHAYEDNCGVCDSDPENDCPIDCNGIPGGIAFFDDCEVCSGGDTGHVANSDEDDCGNCFGNNENMDCNGDCNLSLGAAYYDDCGICSGGYSNHLANSDKDCNGDCYGNAFLDDCDVCSGGESGHTPDTDKDCNGDCFGDALLDECEVCSGGLSEHEMNSDQDCNGDCYGDAFLDDCGVCSGGGNDHTANTDKDCNGDCFGDAFLDDCEVCSGGLSEHEMNSDQDCNGECFGYALIKTYYFDADGDGLGGDESELFCDANVPEGWVSNSADIDDSCLSNYHDCMDVCDGSSILTTYYLDSDGDGFGSSISDLFCSGEEIPNDWVSNSSDTDDDCYSNIHDCTGICDGGAVTQIYWYDNDSDGLGSGNAQLYCSGSVPNGWVLNNEDLDDNCYSNYHDCTGLCNGFAQINIYYADADGDGLGSDIQSEYCSSDVPNGWVLNSDDGDDSCYSNINDCAGICDGNTVIDDCGICDGDNSICSDDCGIPNGDNSSCLDGCGIPNGDGTSCADCAGILNGDAVEDNCGVCDSDPTNDCPYDCDGVSGGDAYEQIYYFDADGDGLGAGDGIEYCNTSVPDGWVSNSDDLEPDCFTNDADECGICAGDNGSCIDCLGVPNGDAVEDNCGVCDSDPENDCSYDCAGVNGGSAFYDGCGICSGGNTEHIPNSDMDECGECFGNNEAQQGCGCFNGSSGSYWYDFDSDGLGSCTIVDEECLPCGEDPECELFCAWDVPPDNWADNPDDIDDNCYSNIHDCMDICDGTSEILTYYEDNDGDGLGIGTASEFCSGDVPAGWVTNNFDLDDNCYSNIHDCMNICDGTSEILTYYEDNDGDGLGIGTASEFCSGDVSEGWAQNSDDDDDNCYSNYHDCAGICNGFAQVINYYEDNDGDGLGGDGSELFCDANVPEGWVLNNDDEDDNCFSNIHDCAEICDGETLIQTYWNDADGDGFGGDGSELFCDANVPEGWVLNNDDEDDNCFSNIHDCAEICDGETLIQTYWNDADGDGFGGDESELFCDSNVPEGWVLNNDDEDDNCFSNIHDCAGICNGESLLYIYWYDNDGDGLGYGTEKEYCNANVPEGWVLNNDDEDDDCFSNIHDCAEICDGESLIQTYWYDNDGDGLGYESEEEYCSANVPEGWVPNNNDIYDNCYSNMIDECGICDGDNSSCSGCTDQDAFNYNCYEGEAPPCNNDITVNDGSCIYYPDRFQFNQSQMQAFYIVENVDIQPLEVEDLEVFTDWIGVFKDSVCVGSYPWMGNLTTIPAMGDDGSYLTENYLISGDFPTFQIFNVSEDDYMNTDVSITSISGSEYNGWYNFEFYLIDEMHGLGPDCAGTKEGSAFIDDCGICVCGSLASDETLFGCYEGIQNEDLGCDGICDPSTPIGSEQAADGLIYGAYIDDCGVCSEGGTGHIAGSDNLGCGCFNPAVESYWLDMDIDGLGYGEESLEMCLENVTELFANNNLDPEPNCPNPDEETLMIDDCGDCIGVDVSYENQNMDSNGTCCSANQEDSCGICFGDDSICNQPIAHDQYLNLLEDNNIAITLTAVDPNNDSITFTLQNDPAHGIISGSGANWTYQPNPNYYGTDVFTFTATDGNWTSNTASITIIIQLVNDIPVTENMDIILSEDNSISIDLSGYDIDGDPLSYFLTTEPMNGSYILSGSELFYTPFPNYNGIDSMMYAVSDSQYTSSEGLININITPEQDPPYLISVVDASIMEGGTFIYNLEAGDVDGDEITYFVNTDVNSEASISNGILTITPLSSFSGEVEVTITVSDGVFDVSHSFILEVTPINDPPIISSISNQTILEDTELVIEIFASDPDGDDLTFTTENTGNASVIITGDHLNLIPELNLNGEFEVSLFVNDGELLDSTIFSVTILPVNDPPELIGDIEDIIVLESAADSVIQLSQVFYDIENGNNLDYAFSENVEGLIVNVVDSVLILSFIEGSSGSGTVEITASDNISRIIVSTSFNVDIVPVNDPPIVDSISIGLDEDSQIEIIIPAQDPEGDHLTSSIINNPVNGTLLPAAENVYVYTPHPDYYGLDSFVFSVSDGENQIESTADITILAVNDTPYFISDILPDALENNEYNIDIQVGDIDNSQNELSLSIINAPSWLELVENSLSGIPDNNDAGLYDVTLELTDNLAIVSLTLSLYVENSNSSPFVQDLFINMEEDSFVELMLIANDPEDSPISFNVTYPLNGTLSGFAPNLIYTPNPDYFGEDSFTYTASDGDMESIPATVHLTILDVNDNPITVDTTFEIVETPLQVDFNTIAFDADGDALTMITIPSSSGDILNTLFGGTLVPVGNLLYEYLPPTSDIETDFMLYKATDGISESGVSMITFNLIGDRWTGENPPITFNDEVNIAEDETKEITMIGFDPFYSFPLDGTESITLIQLPEYGYLGNTTLSDASVDQLVQWKSFYTPDLNYFGTDTISYLVTNPNNPNGSSYEATIIITIYPINDMPEMDILIDLEIMEDNSKEILINASDADNILQFSAISSDENITVVVNQWCEDGYLEDCSGDGDCCPASWVGDGFADCEDQAYGCDLTCYENEYGDCYVGDNDCNTGYVDDCSGDGDCCPNSWIGDGFADCEEQTYGCDLTCYDNDGGDCDGSREDNPEFKIKEGNNNPIFSENRDTSESAILSIIPVADYYGSAAITVTGTEIGGEELNISQIFIVDVLSVNDVPQLVEIDEISFNEDEFTTISLSATDIDYVSFDYSVTTDSEELLVSINNNLLSLSGTNNYNGEANISVIVEDNEGAVDMQNVVVTIQSVNDAPVLAELPEINITEDFMEVIYLSGSDVDSPDLIFSSIGSDHIIVAIDDATLMITPQPDWSGTENIIVSISDGQYVDSSELNITVHAANDAPVFNSISHQSIQEDNSLDLFLNGSDIDGDYLTYFVVNNGGMNTSISTNILTITPPVNYYGEVTIFLSVSDGEYIDYTNFTLTVNAVNDAPIVSQPLEDIILIEDSEAASLVLSSNFEDIDGDTLSFSVDLNTAGLVTAYINSDTLIISTIENQFGGPVIATVTASDQMSNTHSSDNFEIIISGVNDPPILSEIDNQEIDEDGIFIYSLIGTDPDGDQLFFDSEIDSAFGSLSLDGNLLKVIPTENYNGSFQIMSMVSDSEVSDSTIFTLTVNAVNDAPIVSQPLEDIILIEDSEAASLVLNMLFMDFDGDSLVYDVSVAPEGIIDSEINGDSLIISTLPDQFGGPIAITVTAFDQNGAFPAVNQFDVIVEAVNDSPVIISIPDSTAWEDIEYLHQIEVEDIDNDQFYYNLGINPDGMSIDSTGMIRWTPEEGVLNSGVINLYVWDTTDPVFGVDRPDIQTFSIDVIPVNDAPEIISTAPPSATEDILYTYQVVAEDPDDIELNYNLINAPQGMLIDPMGLISWIPIDGVQASGIVTVVVTDGGEDGATPTEQDIFVIVIPVNDPPAIISIPLITEMMVSDTFYYQIEVEDIDDDEFNYVLLNAPEDMLVDSTGLILWIPEYPGQYGPITILVSDDREDEVEPAEQIISVLVIPFTDNIDYCFELHPGANLKSFYALPEDMSIVTMMSSLGDIVEGVITEGGAATQISPGNWVGSLNSITDVNGYWIIVNENSELCLNNADYISPNTEYNLHPGANLISYPSEGSVGVSDALPDDIEYFVEGIITEGGATTQIYPGNWIGSLTSFIKGMGYWVVSSEPISFIYDLSTLSRTSHTDNARLQIPDNYQVHQSTRQAFYFIRDIIVNGEPITNKDWILIYHGETLVGIRQWDGLYTDVPAMGNDGRLKTASYCETGSELKLKILQKSTGDIFHIYNEIPEWEDYGLFLLERLIAREIPSTFELGDPYPNPFNPVVNIVYDIPNDCNLELSVFDMRGRLVDRLISGYVEAGYYEIRWNAGTLASGIYFLRMKTPEIILTRKMVLAK